MIRELFDNIKTFFRIRKLRRALNPDRQFLRSARQEFLNQLHPRSASLPVVARWSYALGVALVIVATTGGLAAYADIKDVAAESPLYTLKRASEQTRLAFTPAQSKPVVHTQLAARRLKEIEKVDPTPVAVAARAQSQTLIAPADVAVLKAASESASVNRDHSAMVKRLHEELGQELEQAISQPTLKKQEKDQISSASVRINSRGPSKRGCEVLIEAVQKRAFAPDSEKLERLQERCAEVQ
jgi:hypothetical protein